MAFMAPRSTARTDLHLRHPIDGHTALVTCARAEGVSSNTAVWLLVRRSLECEGVRIGVVRRAASPLAVTANDEQACLELEAMARPPTTIPRPASTTRATQLVTRRQR